MCAAPVGSEWKPGEELFGKAELVPEPLPDHTMKPPLYRAEQAIEIDLLNAELAEMTEENAADLKHRLAGTKTVNMVLVGGHVKDR